MKDIRFDISLYIIIPVIIAGISILATIASFNITTYLYQTRLGSHLAGGVLGNGHGYRYRNFRYIDRQVYYRPHEALCTQHGKVGRSGACDRKASHSR